MDDSLRTEKFLGDKVWLTLQGFLSPFLAPPFIDPFLFLSLPFLHVSDQLSSTWKNFKQEGGSSMFRNQLLSVICLKGTAAVFAKVCAFAWCRDVEEI